VILTLERKYAGALRVFQPEAVGASAAIVSALESYGFSNVEVWNRIDAYDPTGAPGNAEYLPADFSPAMENDADATHWFLGYFDKPTGEYPPFPGLRSIVEVATGPTPTGKPSGKPSGRSSGAPPRPAPEKPARPVWGTVLAVGSIVVFGVTATIVVFRMRKDD